MLVPELGFPGIDPKAGELMTRCWELSNRPALGYIPKKPIPEGECSKGQTRWAVGNKRERKA